MLTFPTFPGRFQGQSGNVTFPDNVSKKPPYGGIWKGWKRRQDADSSRTFPDGRPIQARLYGGAVPCLEGIVQRAGGWK